MLMNPIIQLQQCLIECAMAGTRILSYNVRLKKIVESLTPLATKNPVFQKMQQDTRKLLELPMEEQGIELLKLLAFVNAVSVTMIQTKRIDGESLTGKVGQYVEIPHSHMVSLVHALTEKGPGRMELLEEMYQEHREYFVDYRVQQLLVEGLKDAYMAQVVCNMIINLGESMLDVLQENLDYNGKRDMGYRVFCISKITKNEALKEEAIEQGSKVVKEAIRDCEYYQQYLERLASQK